MSDGLLSPAEMEAIQKATSGKRPPVISRPDSAIEASPIALIADDREGERARPRALAIANKWAPMVASRVKRAFNLELEISVEEAAVSDGSYLVRDLPTTWSRCLSIDAGKELMIVAVGGPLVEVVAAILLGAKMDEDEEPPPEDRAPSPVAKKIFTRGGKLFTGALLEIFRDEDPRPIETIEAADASEARWRELSDSDPIIVTTLKVESPVAGTIRLIGTPEAFVPPRLERSVPGVPRQVIANVLGGVGVELVVELGGARMPMRDVKSLGPGSLIKLDRSMSEPVPVRCAGVEKARGQVISQNGNFAVEIVSLVQGDTEDQ